MTRLRPVALFAVLAATLLHPSTAAAAPTIAAVAPERVVIGQSVVVHGSVEPATAGEQVQLEQRLGGIWTKVGQTTVSDAAGAWQVTFRPQRGGALRARQLTTVGGSSAERAVAVSPRIFAGRLRQGTVYPFLGAAAQWRIAPADYPSGKVRVELSIDGRSAGFIIGRVANGRVSATLPTRGVGRFRARLVLPARGGFEQVRGGLFAFTVRGARVGSASSVAWNRSLRAALRFRGIHVPGGTRFDARMGDAVIAFHKAYGRPRTTTFEASDWARLTRRAIVPRSRGRGLHIEIDKSRQVLMQVRDGKPVFVIHISSGATGNTPVGRHRIQWKGDWVPSLYGSLLYKSMAFQGAYAIHGYPSVPTTPASHGCVRVPMWIAATLYRRSPVDTPVYVYEGPGTTWPSLGRRRDVPELTAVDPARWADER